MKHVKKHLLSTMVALFLLIIAVMVMPTNMSKVEAAIKISKKSMTLTKGQSKTLKITGTKAKVKWTTKNKSVVTVTQKGKVTAKKKGTTTITAKVKGKKYNCKVTVKNNTKPVTIFSLNSYSLSLKEGETKTISTYIYPGNATNKTIKWNSSNTKVATVSNGKVTAKSTGSSTISATCGGFTATCQVDVSINFNSTIAKNNLTYTNHKVSDGIITIVKNNYKYPVDLRSTAIYYNSQGLMIGKHTDDNGYLEPGQECALFMYAPYDSSYNTVDYSSYKVEFSVSEPSTSVSGNVTGISYNANFGVDNIMIQINNKSNKTTEYTYVAIVFYKNNIPIGYDSRYAHVNQIGSTDYLEFSFPYDSNYNTIYPDNFKVFVNYSYRYTW